jgi:hypothetical protein
VFCCSEEFDPKCCSLVIEQEFSALSGTWEVVSR